MIITILCNVPADCVSYSSFLFFSLLMLLEYRTCKGRKSSSNLVS